MKDIRHIISYDSYVTYNLSHRLILLKIIKTPEEAEILWKIASPLIGEYLNVEGSTFIWMGLTLKSGKGWHTIVDDKNVQNLILSKWNNAISNDHGDIKVLMGRYQVQVSNFLFNIDKAFICAHLQRDFYGAHFSLFQSTRRKRAPSE